MSEYACFIGQHEINIEKDNILPLPELWAEQIDLTAEMVVFEGKDHLKIYVLDSYVMKELKKEKIENYQILKFNSPDYELIVPDTMKTVPLKAGLIVFFIGGITSIYLYDPKTWTDKQNSEQTFLD